MERRRASSKALKRAPKRIDTHEIQYTGTSSSAFNCEGGLAYSITPPQPITGDDQHLLTLKKRKTEKPEEDLESSNEFLRGQLVKNVSLAESNPKEYNRFMRFDQQAR